jgi:hypothetical protein
MNEAWSIMVDVRNTKHDRSWQEGTGQRSHRRERGLTCERCSGKLLYDGENLSCLMCGHEPTDDARVRRGRANPAEMLDALVRFRSELAHCIEGIGQRPMPGSPAERELAEADSTEADALTLVPALAHQSLFAAGHGLIALARGLEPPAPEYGTWGVSNAVLQASGLVAWLLDENVDYRGRALRALAVEAQELLAESAVVAGGALGQTSLDGPFAHAVASNQTRSAQITARTGGGAVTVPGADDLADLLDASTEHRLFSAIVAGRPWALLQTTALASGLGASPSASVVAIQVAAGASWYARATWLYARWMQAAPGESLCGTLERGYDTIGLPDDERTRFWRRLPAQGRDRERAPLRSMPAR